MLTVLAILGCAVTFFCGCTTAQTTDAHNQLKTAAEYAVSTGNTELLSALLKAGLQLDEPLDDDSGMTALHVAVVHNQTRVARVLLDNGASRDARDNFSMRPIDHAFSNEQTTMCDILAKGDEGEPEIGGVPEGVLEEVLRDAGGGTNLVFLAFNEADPPVDLMRRLLKTWPKAKPISAAVVLSPQDYAAGNFPSTLKEKVSGEFGMRVIINIRKKAERQYDWKWGWYSGPLAAGWSSGTVVKKFG